MDGIDTEGLEGWVAKGGIVDQLENFSTRSASHIVLQLTQPFLSHKNPI